MQFLSDRRYPLPDSTAAQPRVLQLVEDDPAQSAGHSILLVAQALARAGGEAVVAGGAGRLEPQLRRAGIDHRPWTPDRHGVFQSASTYALLDTVHQRGLGLVHVHGHRIGLAAKAFAEAANLPLVMSCSEPPPVSGFMGRRSARKHLAGRPIVVPSDHAAQTIRRDFALPEAAVAVVPPGLDLDAWDDGAVSSERAISLALAWGIADDPREVLVVPGASEDPAWLNWVISAAGKPDAPDAVWVLLAGDPVAEATIAERVTRAGAGRRIRVAPECTDWAAACKLASLVLALPQTRPTLCLRALEAQAMGRNVVVADAGAGPEALIPGKTGWLIRDRDVGSLVYAVSAALGRDPVIRGAMAMSARNFIATRFASKAHQSALLDIYAAALASRP